MLEFAYGEFSMYNTHQFFNGEGSFTPGHEDIGRPDTLCPDIDLSLGVMFVFESYAEGLIGFPARASSLSGPVNRSNMRRRKIWRTIPGKAWSATGCWTSSGCISMMLTFPSSSTTRKSWWTV